jgi:integrase/recombinase XerD
MPKRKAPKGCFWRDGILYGRIQVGGTDVKWSLRTDDPKIAGPRREAERKRAVATAHYGDQRRTFQEALEGWEKFITDQIAPKTLKRYASSLAVLQPHLEGLYLDEIDKQLIGEIVASRRDVMTIPVGKKQPIRITNATIKRDLTALSSVLGFAADEEWIEGNPVMAWLRPGGRRKSRLLERRNPIALPEYAHIRMVIDRAPGLFAKLIEAALKTGARLDELARADRQHLDRDRHQFTIVGKRNKLRTIDLTDGGEDFGFDVMASLPVSIETRALFWHRQSDDGRSKRYSQISSNFARLVDVVARQAQKQDQEFRPFTFHHLRHRAAVDWLKSGRSIYVLQQRLGHTSIKTTEMYLEYLTHEERQKVMFGRVSSGSETGSGAAVRNTIAGNN